MGLLRGKFEATDDLDLAYNRIRNWRNIDDLPTEGGVDYQVIGQLDGVVQWFSVSGSTFVVVDWDDILNKPSEYPPEEHTHVSADITDWLTTDLNVRSLISEYNITANNALTAPGSGDSPVGLIIKDEVAGSHYFGWRTDGVTFPGFHLSDPLYIGRYDAGAGSKRLYIGDPGYPIGNLYIGNMNLVATPTGLKVQGFLNPNDSFFVDGVLECITFSTNEIFERTGGGGVTVDGLLIKDGSIPVAAVTEHEAALAIGWSQITGEPSFVNSIVEGVGINTNTSTGTVTVTCDLTWAELADKPSDFTPSAHTHGADEITTGNFTETATAAYVFKDEAVQFQGQVEFGTTPDVYVDKNGAGQLRIQNNGTGIANGKDNYLLIDTRASNFGVTLEAASDSYAFATRIFMKNAFGLTDPTGAFLDINISSTTERATFDGGSSHAIELLSENVPPEDLETGSTTTHGSVHVGGTFSVADYAYLKDDVYFARNVFVNRKLTCDKAVDVGRDLDMTAAIAAGYNIVGIREKIEVEFEEDGGGVISTGIKHDVVVPTDCTIDEWVFSADQSGSIQVDVWSQTYSSYPGTNADSIVTPAIASAVKNTAASLDIDMDQGDMLRFNVDSCATITRGTLTLMIKRR